MTVITVTAFTQDEKAAPAAGPAKETAEVPKPAVESPQPAAGTVKPAEPAPAAEKAAEEGEKVEPGNVTVNFKGADIRTVLAYISEVAGVDIVPAPDVKGIVDLKLSNKPWKVALDIIVRNYGFAYEREGDIIRVVTLDRIKQEELASQVFNLNYSKGKDVVNSIKDIVTDRGKAVYDERTNTVLVTDIPTNLYKVAQIIERLDRKTPQILIETRIIETTLGEDEKLGIDWNVKIAAAGAKRPTTFPFEQFQITSSKIDSIRAYLPQVQTAANTISSSSTGGGGLTNSSTNQALFPTAAGGVAAFPFALQDQFTFGTLDFSQFQAVLELIKSRSDTDIVSNPTIATLNNTEALINVGETLNLPKYERNSTTGKMEITGYEAKDLGIILKVTPHVNDINEIVVDLAPAITDLLRYDTLDRASGVVAPVWSVRQAKTQVMIKDGDTIFIGGLIKENNIDVKKKLPFLGDMFGDVPYLGLLVSKKETVKRKTELIFFMTVNLMAAGRDIKNVPEADKARIPLYQATQQGDVNPKKKVKRKVYN